MCAALQVAALLAELGVTVRVVGFGIARDAAKHVALAQVCERVFDDVNAALDNTTGS